MSYNVAEYVHGWLFCDLQEGEKGRIYLKPFSSGPPTKHTGHTHTHIHIHKHIAQTHEQTNTKTDKHTRTDELTLSRMQCVVFI